MDKLLTIFTPLYNRSKYLQLLYNSILSNASYPLEWLIIDDGSLDKPQYIIDSFSKNDKVEINLIKKENGGKHTAYNLALKEAKGKFFLCLDSDDTLISDSLNNIFKFFNTDIQNDNIGVIALKCTSNGKLLSKQINKPKNFITLFDLYQKMKGKGEYAYIFPTEIARKYPFPVFEDEKFISESVIYNRMSLNNIRFLYTDVLLMQCDYLEDGLTSKISINQKKYPKGFTLEYCERVLLPNSFKMRLIDASKFWAFRFRCKKIYLENFKWNLLFILSMPIGFCLYIYYTWRFNKIKK